MGSMEEETSVICILCVFSVFGTLGNGLVLHVFRKMAGKLTSSIFILALAGTDIIACLVVIPFTITAQIMAFILRFDFFCRLYLFLIASIVPLSAFIMVAIAVDRYICICHPFVHIMTVQRAKIIVSILAAFAIVLGLIPSLGISVYELHLHAQHSDISTNHTHLIKINGFHGICITASTKLSVDFMKVFKNVYFSFFIIWLLVVLILYGMIYRYVSKQRSNRRRQKLAGKIEVNTQSQTEVSSVPMNNSNLSIISPNNLSVKVEFDGKKVTTSLTEKQNGDSNGSISLVKRPGTSTKSSSNEKNENNRLANFKTALMLFIVAVVYIISFLPLLLIEYKMNDYTSVISYHVTNPVIYAFMNRVFRYDLVRMLSNFQGWFHLKA
ncbi:hypothetical protein ACJMK2_008625 [Sinanodonta woodiana]|uniref:G-protein coupled receptors family 1 profile domain-containing protein n=1 Tax=Sinanodonta woodiana TaxID=1069815 RepID=A0ABD3VQ83_SINWO